MIARNGTKADDTMLFRVAAWEFRVRITEEPLVDGEGNRAAGMALWNEREILLAAPPAVPVRNRLEVLLHELKEAWLFYVPRPRGKEEECNLTAVVAAAAMADLERQGGVAALEAMTIHMPAKAEAARQRMMDAYVCLERAVRANAEPGTAVGMAFAVCDKQGDDETPTLAELQVALKAFADLAERERRGLLSGWATCLDDRPTKEELHDEQLSSFSEVRRVLHLECSQYHGDVNASPRYIDDETLNPVRFQILEGVKLKDALGAIDRLREVVATHWGELIVLTDPRGASFDPEEESSGAQPVQ